MFPEDVEDQRQQDDMESEQVENLFLAERLYKFSLI